MRRHLLQPLLLLLPLPVLLPSFHVSQPSSSPRVVHRHLNEHKKGFSPVRLSGSQPRTSPDSSGGDPAAVKGVAANMVEVMKVGENSLGLTVVRRLR